MQYPFRTLRPILFFVLLLNLSLSSTTWSREEAFFSPKDNLEAVVLRELGAAESSIDISIYTFSSKEIRATLLGKLQSGIKVRILIDKGKSAGVFDFVTPLLNAGATVRHVAEINHHKFAIIDAKVLLSSSGNFNSADLAKSYDENLLVCDECDARRVAYQSEFEALFRYSNPLRDSDPRFVVPDDAGPVNANVPGVALFSSSNYEPRQANPEADIRFKVVVDYPGAVAGEMIAAIDAATVEVQVATGHFRSKPLFDALKRAAERGVPVKVFLDSQEYLSKSAAATQASEIRQCLLTGTEAECYREGVRFSRMLAEAGVDVYLKYYGFRWYFPYAPQMHHKFMIVDGKTLFTGSYNWSNNAEFNTFENVAITQSPAIVALYQKNFQDLLAYGNNGYAGFLNLLETATDKIPIKFDPLAVSVSEIDRLLETARRRCPNLYLLPASARECEL